MTKDRLDQIKSAAASAQRLMKKYGSVKRNTFARVSLEEDKWLAKHRPGIHRFTRTFEYTNSDYVQNVDHMSPARRPIVREVWVGARSQSQSDLGHDIEEATGEDMPAGFKKSQELQEDAAELTDLMTMTYSDPKGFAEWIEAEKLRRYDELVSKKPSLRKHRTKMLQCVEYVLLQEMPRVQDWDGKPIIVPCMIDDPVTGEYRPIKPGDMITTVRGSNDDLDALFLEEADDPREQNDFSADGSDHRYSDRFRANTDLEQDFLTASAYSTPIEKRRKGTPVYRRDGSFAGMTLQTQEEWFNGHIIEANGQSHMIPNSALPEGLRHMPSDTEIRRAAQERAATIVLKDPTQVDHILSLTDEIEANLRRGLADVRFDHEGKLVSGYFVNRSEFFASLEQNHLNRKPPTQMPTKLKLSSGREVAGFRPAKQPPTPIDWKQVRGGCSVPVEPLTTT